MLEIEQRKLTRISNGHNFSLGCPIQAHHISRRSKLKKRNLSRNLNFHKFSHGGLIQPCHIWRRPKFNHGRSREIQMVITFHTDVRFGDITHLDARNWTTEVSTNSNGYNFSHKCPIRGHNISRRSKLNNRSSREIRMVITFHTDVRIWDVIYRDARNCTTEVLEKFEWS